ncbi:hypothetical protein [Sphingomonas faeni]|uniref:hypothetical protein n=1 Tax=Sphingomonas faeni TaxID=185950 RepID=UPI00334E6496
MNRLRGEATLAGGTSTYALVFDVNAFCLAEGALGRATDELVDDYDSGRRDLRLTRGLLWAGLQAKHACTISEAGDIMSDLGATPVQDAISAGLMAAFGVVTEGEDGAHPPKTAGDGTG